MQIQQLRYIIAAAESKSFREAAQKLYVAQSSVSVAVKDLERETGLTLFDRAHNGITLTPEGAEFLDYARTVVDQIDLMESRFSRHREARSRLAVSSQHYSLVVDAFGDFMREYEKRTCSFALSEPYTGEIIRDVERGHSDMGFLHLSGYNDRIIGRALDEAGLTFTSLFRATPHAVFKRSHPLAQRSSVSIEDLSPFYRLVQERGDEGSAFFAEEPFSAIAHEYEVVVSDNGTMTTLLHQTEGFVIGTGAFRSEGDLVSVPIDTDEIMDVGVIQRKDAVPSAEAEAFFLFLCKRIVEFDGDIEPSQSVRERVGYQE